MINIQPPSSDDIIRFPSLESLRAAHTELLKRFRVEGGKPEMIAEVEAFIRRGKATGALLDADADRWAAQSQLDYWSTQLYKPSYEPPDAALDEFDPQAAPELDDSLCPYLGLDSFHETHHSVFFGRQRLVGELVHKLKAVRFLAVLGSSGSGKSSMVRAGLIPALKKDPLLGSADWMYYPPMVPGSDPLANLARLIMPPYAHATQVQAELWRFRQEPTRLIHLISERSDRSAVLVVDQFEEIFTLCADEETRQCFVDNLINLSQSEGRQDRVIITMRTDFESNIARLPNLQKIFERATVRITPLNASELREAIESPAARIGLRFEEGVVDSLLHDTLGEPAALPLLQFTLLKLWENRERNRVTWEAYRKLGGGRQALARSADEFYNRLIPEEQVTMRRILLKMVRPGEGLEVTSNRVPRAALYHKAEASDRMDRVLDRLIHARLVRVSEGDIAADEQVEIAHEALVRNWPRLVEWLEEERVTLRQRQRLTTAAEEWQRLAREASVLWRGSLLHEVRYYDDLNQLEAEFVEAGYVAEQAEVQRKLEEAQRQQELEYTKKLAEAEKLRAEEQARSAAGLRQRSLYLTAALGVALVAVVIAIVFNVQAKAATVLAQENASEAQKQAQLARIGELAAQAAVLRESKLDISLLLGVEIFGELDNGQTRSLLLDNAQANPYLLKFLRGHKSKVHTLAFSPDGKTLASASDDGMIILWDVATHQPIGQPIKSYDVAIFSLAFSPDGKTLASANGWADIILWDVKTRKPIKQLSTGHTSAITSVDFSPDGKMLASGSWDDTVILWNVATGQIIGQPLRGHRNDVYSVAFSPDGKTLASGGADPSVIVWDLKTQQPIDQPLRGLDYDLRGVAFSPDGRTLAAAGDTAIDLWDVPGGTEIGRLPAEFASVNGLAFSTNGRMLVAAYNDQSIRLWDVTTRQLLGKPLHGHTDWVNTIAFSPDGKTLASGSNDATVILWNIKNQASVSQALSGHSDQVVSVAFSPNGKTIASGSFDNTIRLWNAATGVFVGPPLRGHTASPNSLAFSPDGNILASGSDDNTIRLWDMTTQKQIGQSLGGHSKWIKSIAFSADGRMLASGSVDGSVVLWDVDSKKIIGPPLRSSNEEVWAIAFSPDGKILASGGIDTPITLWDVETHKMIGQPLRGHTDQLRSLAFSPDGKILASGSLDQTIIFWDVATQKPIGQPLRGHTAFVTSVAFSPDGKMLASGSFDQTVILWDVVAHQPIGQPLRGSSIVWNISFSPDSKTLAAASGDGTMILWNLDPKSWMEASCQRVTRNFTRAEWTQYFHDEPYRVTCPQWLPELDLTPTP